MTSKPAFPWHNSIGFRSRRFSSFPLESHTAKDPVIEPLWLTKNHGFLVEHDCDGVVDAICSHSCWDLCNCTACAASLHN